MKAFFQKWSAQAHRLDATTYSLAKRTAPKKENLIKSYDSPYDLVYILKPSEKNTDLKYSLRSVDKFCHFRYIWFVGYKPLWTKNTKYIPTVQNKDKWKNSIINYMAACKCPLVSDNFVLMNDDFFAINEIKDWDTNLNVYLGDLRDEVEKYKDEPKKSRWKYGFDYAVDLLTEMNCPTMYNYETHLPMIINKHRFLEMMKRPELIAFQQTEKVLHKRSIYKNLYPDTNLPEPRLIEDVKITLKYDLSSKWLKEDWLSVFDNVTNNHKEYPKVNSFLTKLFPEKCRYEI